MTAPAIVIAAHNRPESLQRLLSSLRSAEIASGTDLTLSIDGGGQREAEVVALAEAFGWEHGPSRVVVHDPPLGLVDHFYWCGDRTGLHDRVILLEDDLVVGPSFQRWASDALDATDNDARIAGVCLAAPWFDGYRHLPFEPIADGSDGFYAQVPWFHGMAWTDRMWGHFRERPNDSDVSIHASFEQLAPDEWFPDALRYLVGARRYYLFPRTAHATNTGAAGTHFDNDSDFFQVPLAFGLVGPSRILGLESALAIYDDHMEPTAASVRSLVPELNDLDFTVDLLAVRDPATISTPLLLTTRPVNRQIRQWGASMHPLVANLAFDVAGDAISLGRRDDVDMSRRGAEIAYAKLIDHVERGRTIGKRERLRRQAGKAARTWNNRRDA